MKKNKIKLLSYNIHKGFNSSNRNFVLNEIKDSIRLVHADIVFLQEVLGHHTSSKNKIKDWPTNAQFEYLADEVWTHHAYGKNAVYFSGHHGNAILSKYPILNSKNFNISTNSFEQRGLLHAIIEYPKKCSELHAICLHLGLFESGRKIQLQSLIQHIRSMVPADAPLIVAGDFNDWLETSADLLDKHLGLKEAYFLIHHKHARTFPSWMPVLKLDRIYVRNINVLDSNNLIGKPWMELSDHTAISAEVEIQ